MACSSCACKVCVSSCASSCPAFNKADLVELAVDTCLDRYAGIVVAHGPAGSADRDQYCGADQ